MAIQSIRNVRGNSFCVDCDAPSEYISAYLQNMDITQKIQYHINILDWYNYSVKKNKNSLLTFS